MRPRLRLRQQGLHAGQRGAAVGGTALLPHRRRKLRGRRLRGCGDAARRPRNVHGGRQEVESAAAAVWAGAAARAAPRHRQRRRRSRSSNSGSRTGLLHVLLHGGGALLPAAARPRLLAPLPLLLLLLWLLLLLKLLLLLLRRRRLAATSPKEGMQRLRSGVCQARMRAGEGRRLVAGEERNQRIRSRGACVCPGAAALPTNRPTTKIRQSGTKARPRNEAEASRPHAPVRTSFSGR
jgi:hypothetical protein